MYGSEKVKVMCGIIPRPATLINDTLHIYNLNNQDVCQSRKCAYFSYKLSVLSCVRP